MKRRLQILLQILLFFTTQQVYSQYSTSYLSYEYTEILRYSIKITYNTTGDYKPTTIYDFYGNVLSTLQARYDQNRKVIEKEYGRVWYLELINESNKATLNRYKSTIKAEIDAKAGYADFSKSSVTNSWVNFISQPFRVTSIKDEIKLLQSCQTELNRIKYRDPDNYIYSKRYKSILRTLDKLKHCSPSDIKYLSWENTELNNSGSNNNSSGNNYSSGGYTNPTKEQLSNTGSVRFYVNENIGVIKIYVQNALVGTLDKYYTNKNFVPDCDDNLGGAMDGVNLKVGTYSYYATTNGMTWEGQFTISPGGCITIRLTK